MPDRKPRHGIELLCELVFRPVAGVVARALAPLRVPPPAVVAAGTCAGFAAAVELGRGELLVAAALLQAKTVLDNADGQLARLTGRITAFGRYLDSLCDLLVYAAIFAALGLRVGPWLALGGFVCLTLVLSVNFNVERLYQLAQGRVAPAPPEEGGTATRWLARVYDLVYGPQDRLAEAFARRRPEAWNDARGVHLLANMGLSTQFAVFGACLALHSPAAYVWVVFGCAAAVVLLGVRRELLARRAAMSAVPAVD